MTGIGAKIPVDHALAGYIASDLYVERRVGQYHAGNFWTHEAVVGLCLQRISADKAMRTHDPNITKPRSHFVSRACNPLQDRSDADKKLCLPFAVWRRTIFMGGTSKEQVLPVSTIGYPLGSIVSAWPLSP